MTDRTVMSIHDIFLADCPARTTIELVGSTWAVVVVVALGERPRRYTDLRDRIGGISNKVLTDTLRKLERNGLIERAEIDGSRHQGYRLTGLGESLLEPVAVLSRWAEQHTDALLAAQDARAAGHRVVPTGRVPSASDDMNPMT